MLPPVVSAARLTRRLGRRWALRGIDLEVAAGEAVMVFGANGSGKTTLLRTLSTAIRPSTGTLKLFGAPPDDNTPARLGLLSHADYHYDTLSARENLNLASGVHALAPVRPGAPRTVDEALAQVGLADRADDLVRDFSAGMRKRLAIARILWRAPDLVLFDEPYAQLDPAGGALIDRILLGFRQARLTLIVSTHQLARVVTFCDRAVQIEQGKVVWSGPPEQAERRLPGATTTPDEAPELSAASGPSGGAA